VYRRHDATACAQNSTRNKRAISGTHRTIILRSRRAGVHGWIIFGERRHAYSFSDFGSEKRVLGDCPLSLSLSLSTGWYLSIICNFLSQVRSLGDRLALRVIRHGECVTRILRIPSSCVSRYHRLRCRRRRQRRRDSRIETFRTDHRIEFVPCKRHSGILGTASR